MYIYAPFRSGVDVTQHVLPSKRMYNMEFHNVLSDISVDAFLQKPFSMWKLNNVVEKIMLRAGRFIIFK